MALQGSLSTAEASFMTMLDEGGITAGNTWADAQARLLRDVRFQAVDADARLALFQRYVRARRDIDALNVSDDEKAFMVRLWWPEVLRLLCTLPPPSTLRVRTGAALQPHLRMGAPIAISVFSARAAASIADACALQRCEARCAACRGSSRTASRRRTV